MSRPGLQFPPVVLEVDSVHVCESALHVLTSHICVSITNSLSVRLPSSRKSLGQHPCYPIFTLPWTLEPDHLGLDHVLAIQPWVHVLTSLSASLFSSVKWG